MGVERAVTRWYVLRQVLLTEISRLEERESLFASVGLDQDQGQLTLDPGPDAVHQQLEAARKRLKTLGHSPRPMMG